MYTWICIVMTMHIYHNFFMYISLSCLTNFDTMYTICIFKYYKNTKTVPFSLHAKNNSLFCLKQARNYQKVLVHLLTKCSLRLLTFSRVDFCAIVFFSPILLVFSRLATKKKSNPTALLMLWKISLGKLYLFVEKWETNKCHYNLYDIFNLYNNMCLGN